MDQHLSDPETKRKRGDRGPDRKPRKPRGLFPGERVPLEELERGAHKTLLDESPPAPLAPFVETPTPFDEETARTLVEIGVGLLNDGAAAIVRAVAKKETGDDGLADAAASEIRMSQKIEQTIKTGAVQCAKKYAVRLDYAPEIMLGGGLVIWAGQLSLSVKALKAKGAEIRARTEGQGRAAA